MFESKDKERQLYYDFLREHSGRLTGKERQEFCDAHNIGLGTTYRWDKGEVAKDDFDVVSFLKKHEKEVAEALVKSATSGKNSPAQKIFHTITGSLVEKKEETVRFEPTPSDYARWTSDIVDGLRRHFTESGGVCPVCGGCQTLRNEVCLDTEPEHEPDNKVAALAFLT